MLASEVFEGCYSLESSASKYNVGIDEYVRSRFQENLRTTLRVAVLMSVKTLHLREEEERGGKRPRRQRENMEEMGGEVGERRLDGALAIKIITSSDLWREILEYV